jgi:hypothetical protein
MASFFTTLVPAVLVEQKADPAAEYSPLPLQGAQPAKLDAPLSLNVPVGHSTSALLTESKKCPGGVAIQTADPSSL